MTSDGFILSIYIVSTNVLFKFTIYLAPGGGGGGGGGLTLYVCVFLCVRPKLTFIGQRSRSQGRTLLFEGTVISQTLRHRKCSIFFVDTSLYALSNDTMKT